MNSYIILLRGVNVGGKNILPMKELKVFLEESGFENVQTYIQSGNIVLMGSRNPEHEMGSFIQSNFGFTPETFILSKGEFDSSISNNPYQEYEGKLVHFYFCKEAPRINSTKLARLAAKTESYEIVGNVFYLHAPNGIGRSKLVAGMESCLGVPATGRNLNTINKLKAMMKNA